MTSSILVLTIMNPGIDSASRDFLGWVLIVVVSVNIAGNLLAVSQTVTSDLHQVATEEYELY